MISASEHHSPSAHSWRDRLIVTSPALLAGLLLLVRPGSGVTLCPFALATGMACPGCGMTRAGHEMLVGDLSGALGYHPVAPLIALLLGGGWVWYMLWRAGRARPISQNELNVVLVGIGIILIAVWAVRWTNGSLPPV